MQFIVKQKTGPDSTVTVTEDVRGDWQGPVKVLRFVSDQSLTSQSERAWNVCKAIRDYAHERGYRTPQGFENGHGHKSEVEAIFDPDLLSHIQMEKVRKQVEADPRFVLAATVAEQKGQTVNREYGRTIRLLKNLTTALENREREELERVGAELVAVQKRVLVEVGVPDEVNDRDRRWLAKPFVKLERNSFGDYGVRRGELPDNLDVMLALLEEVPERDDLGLPEPTL